MNILGILSLLLCAISVISADYCLTDRVAEGSPFTITQYVKKSDVVKGVVKWQYINAKGDTLTPMTCDINNNIPCPSTFLYTGTMATYRSTKYKVTLTGKSMSRLRDQSTWSWYGDGDKSIGQCDLPVYSLQSDHECNENILLSSDGKNVLWGCIVDKVYPEMDCLYDYRKGTSGNFMSVSSDHVTYNKVTTDGAYPPRSVYHQYTCAMNLPISTLTGAGSYQFMFRATVLVDAKGGVKTTFKEIGPKTLTLTLPQVELVGCPNTQDYIKEGDTKRCWCRIKTQGIPPGQPVWLDSNINPVGNDASNGVNYLSLKYNSEDQNPTYNCRGVSPLGSGPDVTYTPKFAYGPSQISISFNSNNKLIDSINKCEETTSFPMYCDIALVNVNPKPTMIVTSSDGSTITPQLESTPTGYYRYKYKVVPKGGGTPTITCQATNAIFSDLTATKSKTITVQEPPPSAPVMTATISNTKQTVENGSVVIVTSGDTVQVKCRVDGGFPGVSKVNTTCAGVKNVNNGIEATQTVNAKKEDNNKKCSCEADHVTRCYHKTSEFTLNVQYTPSMTQYTANSESQTLRVSAEKPVTFVCDVEGNPRPTVSVKGQRSGETVTLSNATSGSYGQKGTGTKEMSCQDTDVYRCVADNGVGDGVAGNVSVFVECVPELPSGFQTVKEFKPINGTDLEVIIPIIGYPEPKKYTLTKVGNQNRRRRRRRAVTGDRTVDESLYNVTYISDQPPKGKVVLTMFGLTSSDSGKYLLNINNGIAEKGFDFSFNVTIAAENNDNGEEDSSIVPIIAGIVAAIVVICIIVIVVIVFKKWRGKQDKKARDKQRMAAVDDKPTMRMNKLYAGMNNGDDNDEGSERDSDFVEFDNVIYGSNNGVTNDPVAQVYTDYNSIVPTITSATARPKNLSAYSDVNLDENPYEDTDLTNTPIASKPAPPKKPTPALKPSSPATTDVTHKVTPADEVDDVNLYSAVNLETKSTQKKQPVVDMVETEDAYGFPLRKSIPVIPEKNFVDGDGSGGDHGASVKKQKQKPQVPSKKGQMPKNNNNNNANSNHRHSKNNQAYNNMALVFDKDGAARIAVGSEDGTYFNNSNNVDNVYGNTPVTGETDDDNVYGNAAVC